MASSTKVSTVRAAESLILLAISLLVASPTFSKEWRWLGPACASFEVAELALLEETGTRATIEPQHLPVIEAMIAARQACRGASMVEAMVSFDADPRADARQSSR
jgi:hypothetical protein